MSGKIKVGCLFHIADVIGVTGRVYPHALLGIILNFSCLVDTQQIVPIEKEHIDHSVFVVTAEDGSQRQIGFANGIVDGEKLGVIDECRIIYSKILEKVGFFVLGVAKGIANQSP